MMARRSGATQGSAPHPSTSPFGWAEVAGPLAWAGSLAEGPGTMIGPYKLLQKIGEGGMGAVFMAEQERMKDPRFAKDAGAQVFVFLREAEELFAKPKPSNSK